MNKPKIITERGPLGQLVVNIEFVVISIVAGISLSTLGVSAAGLSDVSNLVYWPYIATGMLFVLFFWSEAISHTISFIDWPMSLTHTFLYFLIGYFQVVAFSNLTDTLVWFWVFLILSLVGVLLYLVDLNILRQQQAEIAATVEGKLFYADLLREQKQGLYILLPATIAFNVITLLCLYLAPEIFLEQAWHVVFAVIQGLTTLGALWLSTRRFKTRSRIISQLYGSDADRIVS